jgi:hypothetical protein
MTSTAENVQTPSPLARRWTVRSFATTWASQIGITVAFVVLWVAFIVLAPDTFLDNHIYISFAQTTPCFALPALLLTMVIVSGDIDLSFPSIMGLGMVGFIAVERTTGNVALAVLTALAVGALAGLLNGGLRHPHRHPGAGRHDRHAVPVPRADARLGQRPELRPRGSEGLGNVPGPHRTASWGPDAVSCGWSWWRSGRGCCSTGIASGRTAT